ncbi:MAG TPA: hypothetical protein EYP59_01080 [Thiotrichaceae bacterium]|nr:hypothetical protein [Thiotrichaceae bacterium]
MLDSLYIKNFRLFKELSIKRLGRVNLIVGKNNSGKTGLLEALLLYASNASPDWINTLISERSENWEVETSSRNQRQPDDNSPLRHLFYERHFPQSVDAGIEIGSLNYPNNRIHLHTRYYQIVENEEGARRRIPITKPHPFDLMDVLKALEFQESRESQPILLSYLSPIEAIKPANQPKMAVEWVSSAGCWNDKRVAELWDNITLTDLKEEVVTSLQIIEPKLQDLGLTIGTEQKRFVIARFKASKERIPLDSLGEGMSRLFYLTLALVNSSDGFLLIDEFENGLHYSVQSKVWELIFRVAKMLNVQVFATTHSWDCVMAFQAVSQNHEDATLCRLGRSIRKSDFGSVMAIEYDQEERQIVTQAQSEVRG